jgi:hypothetical protein
LIFCFILPTNVATFSWQSTTPGHRKNELCQLFRTPTTNQDG